LPASTPIQGNGLEQHYGSEGVWKHSPSMKMPIVAKFAGLPSDQAPQWTPADDLSIEAKTLQAAREIDRNLALTPGPGLGKTEMPAQRADFLLRAGTSRHPQTHLGDFAHCLC